MSLVPSPAEALRLSSAIASRVLGMSGRSNYQACCNLTITTRQPGRYRVELPHQILRRFKPRRTRFGSWVEDGEGDGGEPQRAAAT
jgi:hypothetical protein